MPAASGPLWLHLGCGERVFDGFVNLDFIPHDERVTAWNLLDLWPEGLTGTVEGLFCEDVLEHFFLGEQVYILCNVNRALKTGAVARTLMPSLARLVDLRADYRPGPEELLHTAFGVDTGGDALNIGMRFSGHRWLHDAQSLGRLAELCGFDVVSTTCATSTVARFNGLNLRDENNSLSFANDLRKVRTVSRTLLAPQPVNGASLLEEMGWRRAALRRHVGAPDHRISRRATLRCAGGHLHQHPVIQPVVVRRAQPQDPGDRRRPSRPAVVLR